MPKPYKHLILEERALMQVWLEHGLSLRAIARKLRHAPSTITREFSRNTAHKPQTSAAPTGGRPPLASDYCYALAQKRAQRLANKPRMTRKTLRGNALWALVLELCVVASPPSRPAADCGACPIPSHQSRDHLHRLVRHAPGRVASRGTGVAAMGS